MVHKPGGGDKKVLTFDNVFNQLFTRSIYNMQDSKLHPGFRFPLKYPVYNILL